MARKPRTTWKAAAKQRLLELYREHAARSNRISPEGWKRVLVAFRAEGHIVDDETNLKAVLNRLRQQETPRPRPDEVRKHDGVAQCWLVHAITFSCCRCLQAPSSEQLKAQLQQLLEDEDLPVDKLPARTWVLEHDPELHKHLRASANTL